MHYLSQVDSEIQVADETQLERRDVVTMANRAVMQVTTSLMRHIDEKVSEVAPNETNHAQNDINEQHARFHIAVIVSTFLVNCMSTCFIGAILC